MVHLWRGFHHSSLLDLLKTSWQSQELVILIPAYLRDFSFLKISAADKIRFHGDWPEEVQTNALSFAQASLKTADQETLKKAVLGVFTSGTTTGVNRLVFYSRENIETSLRAIRELYQTARIQKIFSYPQPTHTFGLVLGYMHAVLHGLEIHFSEGAYSKKAHEKWLLIADETTLTLGTPTHFIDLIHFVKEQKKTPPMSYTAIVGGARATRELWLQLRSVLNIAEPSVGYGATEASPGVTHLPPGIEPQEDGDIGYALAGVKVETFPEEGVFFEGANACLAILENGGLRHSKKILLKDYLVADRQGDKVRFTFLGRTDLLVNRGGLKLSLEVIEGKLGSLFGCKCLAISVFDARLGEDVVILVQPGVVSAEQILNTLKNDFGLNLPPGNILLTEIPHTANGKYDRKEAQKIFLRKRDWSFPVVIPYLSVFLPHRGPAVWIDSILETKKHFGVGQVKLRESASYFSRGRVRESVCIEWIAQTYGYTVALNDLIGILAASEATKVFIVEVKNSEFHSGIHDLKQGDEVRVEALCTHDFGVLKVVEGKVFHQEKLLARVGMKLYCGH
jgi:acyl-CoA synthetase (AMP-forming)/AMP-acid ligase II